MPFYHNPVFVSIASKEPYHSEKISRNDVRQMIIKDY
jgi:hypothetical protein